VKFARVSGEKHPQMCETCVGLPAVNCESFKRCLKIFTNDKSRGGKFGSIELKLCFLPHSD
jgi:hypothetical protein